MELTTTTPLNANVSNAVLNCSPDPTAEAGGQQDELEQYRKSILAWWRVVQIGSTGRNNPCRDMITFAWGMGFRSEADVAFVAELIGCPVEKAMAHLQKLRKTGDQRQAARDEALGRIRTDLYGNPIRPPKQRKRKGRRSKLLRTIPLSVYTGLIIMRLKGQKFIKTKRQKVLACELAFVCAKVYKALWNSTDPDDGVTIAHNYFLKDTSLLTKYQMMTGRRLGSRKEIDANITKAKTKNQRRHSASYKKLTSIFSQLVELKIIKRETCKTRSDDSVDRFDAAKVYFGDKPLSFGFDPVTDQWR